MTPTTTNAPRVEPVYGWAAVAPDGVIVPWHIYRDEVSAEHAAGTAYAADSGFINWRRAYRAGWRVIRVQISPAGEREDMKA